MKRLFIGVPVTPQATAELFLKMKSGLETFKGRGKLTAPPDWHITLKFLGPVRESQESLLTNELPRIGVFDSFRMTLQGVGGFPSSERAKIGWLGLDVEGTKLITSLAKGIEDLCSGIGFARNNEEFTPHMTLMRFSQPEGLAELRAKFENVHVEMDVRDVVLYQSHTGVLENRYLPLSRFKLRETSKK